MRGSIHVRAQRSTGQKNQAHEHDGPDTWEVDAPATVEVHRLIAKFIKTAAFGFKATDDAGTLIPYRLMWTEKNRYLTESETLSQAGVADGDTLAMITRRGLARSRRLPDTRMAEELIVDEDAELNVSKVTQVAPRCRISLWERHGGLPSVCQRHCDQRYPTILRP